MVNVFVVIQILISVALTVFILIQAKGVGLGRSFGGGGEFYKSRRGVEKVVFNLTVVFTALFLISSVAGALIR